MKKSQLRYLIREEIKKSYLKENKYGRFQPDHYNSREDYYSDDPRMTALEDYAEQIEGMSTSEALSYLIDQGVSPDEAESLVAMLNTDVRDMFNTNEGSRTLQVTDGNGRLVLITDPKDIEDFLAGEEVYGEDKDGESIAVYLDSALDHQMAEGTCGYDTDAKTGKKLTTPGGLKESAIELGYLSEIKISRNIEIDIVGNDIMIKQGDKDFGKLVGLNIAYIEGTDRLYRGYLHTENKQLNLNGGESGLFEFYDAVGAGRGAEVEEFFSKYGVEITSSEFDVS